MLNEVMCHRVGAPPLRFRGTLLSHREVQGAGADRLFLSLWARHTRTRRDLVVAFSERRCDWRAHALVAKDLDAAINAVESRCDAMRETAPASPNAPDTATRDGMIEAMEIRCREAIDVRQFRQLAAFALDDWLTLLERGRTSTETHMKET
ncbi:MAG: hypothetical protein ACOCTP_01335 [Roseicyclus sp.]